MLAVVFALKLFWLGLAIAIPAVIAAIVCMVLVSGANASYATEKNKEFGEKALKFLPRLVAPGVAAFVLFALAILLA